MTVLYLTRHGETEWNKLGRMQGQKDPSLTEKGKLQAQWLGDRLNDIDLDIIISSSSGRAVQTAEIIKGDRNIEMVLNDNLKEISLGEWEGKYHIEIEINHPDQFNNMWNYPHLYKPIGGETFVQLLSRVSSEIESIISANENKTILIVTHAVVLKTLIAYFEGRDIKDLWNGVFMKSTCLTMIEINENKRKIVLKGDVSHYQD